VHARRMRRKRKETTSRYRIGAAIATSLSELPSIINNFLIEKTYTTI
jgi:hypothetical protein